MQYTVKYVHLNFLIFVWVHGSVEMKFPHCLNTVRNHFAFRISMRGLSLHGTTPQTHLKAGTFVHLYQVWMTLIPICGNSPASLKQNVRWLLGASSDGLDHLRRFQQFSLVSQCESKEPFLAAASPCPERQKGEMNARECSRSSRLISIAHPKQEFWQ